MRYGWLKRQHLKCKLIVLQYILKEYLYFSLKTFDVTTSIESFFEGLLSHPFLWLTIDLGEFYYSLCLITTLNICI